MFLHLYRYALKNLIRQKEIFFWVMMFPIVLGTLFFVSFGSSLKGDDIKLSAVPVAVVEEEENKVFDTVLDEVSKELLTVTRCDKEAAVKSLTGGDVKAIIYVCEKPYMEVTGSGISQTIVKSFLDEYAKQVNVLEETIKENPLNVEGVVKKLSEDVTYVSEEKLYKTEVNLFVQYFYALIAMGALYASFVGLIAITNLQANLTTIGMRREISATKKLVAALADISAAYTIQVLSTAILLLYLVFVLKVDLGGNYLAIILSSLLCGYVGVAMGAFVGVMSKKSYEFKNGLVIGIAMLFSFMADLMASGIKYLIRTHVPPLYYINPASLMTDAIYAVNMYGYGERFLVDIVALVIIGILLTVGTAAFMRRKSYVSL